MVERRTCNADVAGSTPVFGLFVSCQRGRKQVFIIPHAAVGDSLYPRKSASNSLVIKNRANRPAFSPLCQTWNFSSQRQEHPSTLPPSSSPGLPRNVHCPPQTRTVFSLLFERQPTFHSLFPARPVNFLRKKPRGRSDNESARRLIRTNPRQSKERFCRQIT